MWTPQRIATDIALYTPLRPCPWPARSTICAQESGACIKPAELARVAGLPIAGHVGPAPAGVTIGIARLVAWCERKAAGPVEHSVNLPPAGNPVQRFCYIVAKFVPAAKRNFPQRGHHEHVRPIVVGRTVRISSIDRVVRVGEIHIARPRVMR